MPNSSQRTTLNLLMAFCIAAMTTSGVSCATNPYATDDPPATVLSSTVYDAELDFQKIDWTRLNAAVFHASNEARRKHRRAALEHHPVLEKAAFDYAVRSARKGFIEHEDSTSKSLHTPEDRVRAAGAKNPMVAENLATAPGFAIKDGERVFVLDMKRKVFARTPDGPAIPRHTYASFARHVVQRWLDSPGHRRNLLDENARQLGCGVAMYDQNGMPSFAVVQNFQAFEPLKS